MKEHLLECLLGYISDRLSEYLLGAKMAAKMVVEMDVKMVVEMDVKMVVEMDVKMAAEMDVKITVWTLISIRNQM